MTLSIKTLGIMTLRIMVECGYAVSFLHTAWSWKLALYAECHYAECHYAECHYTECHYAVCHYAESRGATKTTYHFLLKQHFQTFSGAATLGITAIWTTTFCLTIKITTLT